MLISVYILYQCCSAAEPRSQDRLENGLLEMVQYPDVEVATQPQSSRRTNPKVVVTKVNFDSFTLSFDQESTALELETQIHEDLP